MIRPAPRGPAALALARRRGSGGPRIALFHAQQSWRDSILSGKHDFFVKLGALLRARGFDPVVIGAGRPAAQVLRRCCALEVFVGDMPGGGARSLHALPSPVWGFWYLDPLGVHAHASLTLRDFCADMIDPDRAAWFFNGVTGHMLRENVSKLRQAPRGAPLPPARAVVFLQDIDRFRIRQHYLTTEEMLTTTLTALARQQVYVKPHPDQSPGSLARVRAILSAHPAARISTASLHDLIAASDMVVTQNSAAGFEALMQRKPVITCARAAYHHATCVAKTPQDLIRALTDAPARMAGFPFDKYLTWFLADACLEPAKPDFEDRAWAIIADRLFLHSA